MNQSDAIAIANCYGSCRSLFERARHAAGMVPVLERRLAEGVGGVERRGSKDGPRPLTSDPTAAAAMRDEAARAELERERGELQRCRDLVEAAAFVAFGVRGGLPNGMGATWCETLLLYYIRRMPWAEVARRTGASEVTCRARRDAACEWVDSVGFARAVWGRGAAQ